MESFNIRSELVDLEKNKNYGNMRFFFSGNYMINKKGIGLYLTLIIIILTTIASCSNISKFKEEIFDETTKTKMTIIFIFSGFILLILTLLTSFKNPGYYKPYYSDDNDDLNKNMICRTCKILKTLRVFHCKDCNLCVHRHDHHCPWLSVCIGKHNHKRFLVLIVYSLLHSVLYFSFFIYILANYSVKIDNASYWSGLFLIIFSGLVNIFLVLLIFYQIYFISQDITTSEYLRMDKYKANLFDDNFKVNWRKFLFDEDNFEKDLIYNDNAKHIIHKTYLIENYYRFILIEREKDKSGQEKDIEKNGNLKKENQINESSIDALNDQTNTTFEYFKTENSRKSKFLEN